MIEFRHKLAIACCSAAMAFLALPPAALQAQTSALTTRASAAVPARITQKLDESRRATLKGHVLPFLTRATDGGAIDDGEESAPILLMFSRTAQQQADLDALTDALHNKSSAQFHQWLTPAQFGARFSPADSDIAQVRAWLESKGLRVLDVPPSKSYISFTGTAGQLRNAFGVSIHHITIDGDAHVAAVNEPQIPAAFASVIAGLHHLDDVHGKPLMKQLGQFHKDEKTGKMVASAGTLQQPHANLTDTEGGYQVGPQDFYTIYDENRLLQSGVTGSGQAIALIEEVQVNPADVNSFRSVFNLPAYPSTPNPAQGGVNYLYGSTTGLNGYASCTAPATVAAGLKSGEESEADLDLQWSGTVAPNATIDFVACGGTNVYGSQGVDHAATYVANYLAGKVVAASLSYGACEAGMAASSIAFYNNTWQQMAVEGITPIVSSGDSGSELCYRNSTNATTLPPSSNGWGSSAYNISAGGTDFGDLYETANYSTAPSTTWWSATNGPGLSSALSYIPETTWGGYCSNPLFASYLQYFKSTSFGSVYTGPALCSSNVSVANGYTATVGGSGGISIATTIPSWQSVYGIGKNYTSTTFRNTPDVSLFAANGFWGHFLPYCESDAGTCTAAGYGAESLGAGGTSFVSPQLAGLMALVAQKTGQTQGQANYTIYNLAAQQYGGQSAAATNITDCSGSKLTAGQLPPSTCIFHDVSNDMPSLQGGTITAGIQEPCHATYTANKVTYTSPYCYTAGGTSYGISTVPGTTPSAATVAYTVSPGFDDATGLGSLDITNLVNNWNNVSAKTASTTTLKASSTSVGPTDTVTLTATVVANGRNNAPPAGTVSFYDSSASGTSLGTATIGTTCTGTLSITACSGTASLSFVARNLNNGDNNIIAVFSGDAANDAPSTSTAVDVSLSAPSATVTVPAQSFSVGSATTTLSASLTYTGPLPTGAVSFAVDGTNYENGTCRNSGPSALSCSIDYPTANLSATTHTLTATLVRDTLYGAATGSAALTPGTAKPTVHITVPSQTIAVGTASANISLSATFTAGVIPTGTTSIAIDGANQTNAACYLTSAQSANCSATLPTGSLAAGTHTISAYNQGDANYSTSVGTGTLTVQ